MATRTSHVTSTVLAADMCPVELDKCLPHLLAALLCRVRELHDRSISKADAADAILQ